MLEELKIYKNVDEVLEKLKIELDELSLEIKCLQRMYDRMHLYKTYLEKVAKNEGK